MYGVGGIVVAGAGTGTVLAFTGPGSMVLVVVAVGLIFGGLLLMRFAALRKLR